MAESSGWHKDLKINNTHTQAKEYILPLFIAILIAVGIYSRFKELAWHFTSIDDIGVARTFLEFPHDIFVIPKRWTYAPLQFFFSRFLISPDQSYRELLFWGRLIPCLSGIATVLIVIVFYRRYEKQRPYAVICAMTLIVQNRQFIYIARRVPGK